MLRSIPMSGEKQLGRLFQRFIGLELSGPHSERSSVVSMDHYEAQGRLVVSSAHSGLGGNKDQTPSADEELIRLLDGLSEGCESFGLCTQAPITLPPFFRDGPIRERESSWLRDYWNKVKPRPKAFLPYLNRPIDVWLRYFSDEGAPVPESFGANRAPIAARVQFLQSASEATFFESFAPASFLRLSASLDFRKSWAEDYTDLDKGTDIRADFLEALSDALPSLFMYEHDQDLFAADLQSFHAFVLALTLWLSERGHTEARPPNFPKESTWALLPRPLLKWSELK